MSVFVCTLGSQASSGNDTMQITAYYATGLYARQHTVAHTRKPRNQNTLTSDLQRFGHKHTLTHTHTHTLCTMQGWNNAIANTAALSSLNLLAARFKVLALLQQPLAGCKEVRTCSIAQLGSIPASSSYLIFPFPHPLLKWTSFP